MASSPVKPSFPTDHSEVCGSLHVLLRPPRPSPHHPPFCVPRVFWLIFHDDTTPRWDSGSLNFHAPHSFLLYRMSCCMSDSPSSAPSSLQPLFKDQHHSCWYLYHFPVSDGGSTNISTEWRKRSIEMAREKT